MKRSLIALLSVLSLSASAQNTPFRGTITYQVKEKGKEESSPKLTAWLH